MREVFGREAIRHAIISHTESVSDLLEVLVLLKECGLVHGTLGDPQAKSDLRRRCRCSKPSPICAQTHAIMRDFFALLGIAAMVRAAGNEQEVMLG